jgi:hypothetical protein
VTAVAILAVSLALAVGWLAGHRTARVRLVFIGGTPQQDDAAFIADEAARFWQLVNSLDLPDPDDPRNAP